MKISELIRKAIAELRIRGLNKGGFWDDNNPPEKVCAFGAVYAALGYLPERTWKGKNDATLAENAWRAISEQAPLLYMPQPYSANRRPRTPKNAEERKDATKHFPWYNDLPETTLDEIIMKMEAAAVAMEAKGM